MVSVRRCLCQSVANRNAFHFPSLGILPKCVKSDFFSKVGIYYQVSQE